MTRIALLDYGMGNMRSVEKALARAGAYVARASGPEVARAAEGLVLPGVGAFPAGIERIRSVGLDELVADRVAAGTPLLGICLGMQLLFERSTERGGGDGLGFLAGEVTELRAPGRKLPHIGWEPVELPAGGELLAELESGTPFYFVHSFAARPADPRAIVGTARWGETFAAVVASPPVYGVQFHPEKSSAAGLRLLGNFVRICARAPAIRS